MPLFLLSVVVQVAIVVHIVKTGRNTTWIWIVVMLPVAGAIAYFVVEVLPGLTGGRRGRQAGRKVRDIMDPNRDFKAAERQFAISDSVENSMRLAQEHLEKGQYEQAKALYEKCLTGPHKDDPHLMFGLAKAAFGLGQAQEVKDLLDELIEKNPDYKNQDAHLLYARALENLGLNAEAEHEYHTLHDYYSGPQASYYYARFLTNQAQIDKAERVIEDILEKAELSGSAYNRLHQDVLTKVKQLKS